MQTMEKGEPLQRMVLGKKKRDLHMPKKNRDPHLIPYMKTNAKWICVTGLSVNL